MAMLEPPIITNHAFERAKERKNWKYNDAKGQINAVFKNGERIGRIRTGNRHSGQNIELIVSNKAKVALVYDSDTNKIPTLLTPKEVKIAYDIAPKIEELHNQMLKEIEEKRESILQYNEAESFLLEYEKQKLEEEIMKLQAKILSRKARIAAIDATLNQFEDDVDEIDNKQSRVIRSLASVKMTCHEDMKENIFE